jgi:hypothetical protein
VRGGRPRKHERKEEGVKTCLPEDVVQEGIVGVVIHVGEYGTEVSCRTMVGTRIETVADVTVRKNRPRDGGPEERLGKNNETAETSNAQK